MPKSYICQLQGGNMLVYQDGWFGVEHKGYPVPDCQLGQFRGQAAVLRAILGYDIEDYGAFMQAVSGFEPMLFDDFKYRIVHDNIGGGCPDRIKCAIETMKERGFTLNQALFLYTLPSFCVAIGDVFPKDEDIVAEYADIVSLPWSAKLHSPDWRFRNNIILLTGCGKVTDKHFDFIQDAVSICMMDEWRKRYNYLSGITLDNGKGAMVLTDTYSENEDIVFLYQAVTGVDLSAGEVASYVMDDGSCSCSYEIGGKPVKGKPIMRGVVERRALKR